MADEIPDREALVNAADLRTITNGDETLLAEIIHVFREDSERMMRELGAAVMAGDAGAAMRTSHTLAGALSVFGPSPLVESARAIESLAREERLGGAKPRVLDLGRMIERLNEELSRLVR